MYPVWAVAVTGAFFIWLLILTFLTLKQKNFLKSLFPKDQRRDIRNKFQEVLEVISGFEKTIQILENRLTGFKRDSLGNIQKLAVLRYNPYNDTGGEQSFSLVLLDGKMNGVLITSLHSRAGTRIYLKNILLGKSELELSKEEDRALRRAIEK
ncbi:DUF4446 family protein [Candidatus Daviesbacteria bacterium]|nr:DUF4446 family protein [Candidatus Daviesbacteria bacterium]